MRAWFFVIFFFVILIPLVLGIVLPVYKKHRKVTGGIINYDSIMRKFVYKVYLSKDEIVDALSEKNDADELSCAFDFERSAVMFSKYGSSMEYNFQISEYEGFSILKLTQIPLIGVQGIMYKLNPFIVRKINAEIVPFSQYEF